jgi:hypothetical protein
MCSSTRLVSFKCHFRNSTTWCNHPLVMISSNLYCWISHALTTVIKLHTVGTAVARMKHYSETYNVQICTTVTTVVTTTVTRHPGVPLPSPLHYYR